MTAEKSALKIQRKSFRGEIMYIWKGFDIQQHLSDTERKNNILSLFVSMMPFAEVLYRIPQKSLDNGSFKSRSPIRTTKTGRFFYTVCASVQDEGLANTLA